MEINNNNNSNSSDRLGTEGEYNASDRTPEASNTTQNETTDDRKRDRLRRNLRSYASSAYSTPQKYISRTKSSGTSSDSDTDTDTDTDEETVVGGPVGDEQIQLFPSYAKLHRPVGKQQPSANNPSTSATSQAPPGEVETAIYQGTGNEQILLHFPPVEIGSGEEPMVDVDVRGWIYAPHRGPLTRTHRFLIRLLQQLSGIPSLDEDSSDSSSSSSSSGSEAAKIEKQKKQEKKKKKKEKKEKKEKELQKAAEDVVLQGKIEQENAERGEYTEEPSTDPTGPSEQQQTKSAHPAPPPDSGPSRTTALKQRLKRELWFKDPATMSPEEIAVANEHLLTRTAPFITHPLALFDVKLTFYDSTHSTTRTTPTNIAGHFNARQTLPFIPTHVKVSISETQSATQPITLIQTTGISLISDIDDTIKHTSIGGGARETFRNLFIMELDELTIGGVREWYTALAERGVSMHYVSNSPWQFFGILQLFFELAGIPRGSFHMKHYWGKGGRDLVRGLWEPVAERKKDTLEGIMCDFPERKFILVGDSGEADLEVYMDVVRQNPGTVVGVFIRDVTTPRIRSIVGEKMERWERGRKKKEQGWGQWAKSWITRKKPTRDEEEAEMRKEEKEARSKRQAASEYLRDKWTRRRESLGGTGSTQSLKLDSNNNNSNDSPAVTAALTSESMPDLHDDDDDKASTTSTTSTIEEALETLELWEKRWAKAEAFLNAEREAGRQDVVLRKWYVGGDVQDIAVKLVDDCLKGEDAGADGGRGRVVEVREGV